MIKDIEIIPNNIHDFLKWLPKSDSHTREQAIRYHAARGVESYIIIGALLCKARDNEDWKRAECNSFREWVEQEERISAAQASRMMTIWEKLNKYLPKYYDSISQISFTNLYEVARVSSLLSEAQLTDLLSQAATDTERGFKNNIKEIEKKNPTDLCDHVRTEPWRKCLKCGIFIRGMENE